MKIRFDLSACFVLPAFRGHQVSFYMTFGARENQPSRGLNSTLR